MGARRWGQDDGGGTSSSFQGSALERDGGVAPPHAVSQGGACKAVPGR
nr:hypothetical protein [Rhodopirellula sp. SM50]